mgnify:CR=1 FL=1
MQKGFPPRGKLSAELTDEGRVCRSSTLPGNVGKPALIRPCGATFPQGGRLGYIFYPVICRLPGNILHQHRLQLHPAQGSVQRVGQQGEIAFQAAGLFVAVILPEGHKIVAAPLQKLAQRRGTARQTIVG